MRRIAKGVHGELSVQQAGAGHDPLQRLDFLGLDEVAENTLLWLIEWPERGLGALPKADLLIEIELHGEGRLANLRSETETGAAWLARTSKMAGFRASS